ncbi:sensor histidine kinase [Paenibacillus doosanensis]|uniref:Sensor histidine kinase YehU n=1 Tax=Paenibacillus konkukensis TaxID=2020716 RepID=A0ABY4RN97_9BACL|nr:MULTISPECIES: sensor histidine kinase [Paenibacillus]MCS7462123.1 sensor histidine kinase [Paenibacillus doosanensis]UQZ83495.1 Sensor histidine kinase YehU [Paenibacillus konkukensis]
MERLFKKYPIRYLYFGSFTVFVILLLMIIVWTSYHFSMKSIVKTAASYQEKMLVGLNDHLQSQFNFIESISLSASRNQDMINLLGNPADPYERHTLEERVTSSLLRAAFSSPVIDSIHVYIGAPPSINTIGPIMYLKLEEMNKEPWSDLVMQSDFVWIGEHNAQTQNGVIPVASFAHKLTSISGDYAGVILINIKASTIQDMLGEQGLQSLRLLLDSSGRKIVQAGNPGIVLNETDYQNIVRSVDGLSEAHQTSSVKQLLSFEKALIVSSQMTRSGWIVTEITPWHLLAQDSWSMIGVLCAIGAVSIVAVLLISLYLTRMYNKPIYLLLQSMNRYPELDLNPKLPRDYNNEFGQLFTGYDRLLGRIKDLLVSLEEQYRRKKETEIKALQAMINPHFLYNTLDQLNWMAIKDGNSRMSRVLDMTGRMLRIGLSGGESLIPVSQELDFVEYYLQIQRTRLGDSKIHYRVDASEEALELYIPKMTLQPFVENCIKHGFHEREHGAIAIGVEVEDGWLLVTITDNGNGLGYAQTIGKKTSGGYGIGNVRSRLDAFFEHHYQLDIQGLGREGTQVTLRIPKLASNNQGKDEADHVENSDH